MKKILLIVAALFFLTSCSKASTSVIKTDTPNPKGYMTDPQILISTEHNYKQESWGSEDVELKDKSITLQGNSFFATIVFLGDIPEDKLREAVTVDGYSGEPEVTITPSDGKTVFYGCYRKLNKNQPYKLTISKDIADADGKTLKADIQKEITLKPDTTALYTLAGSERNFTELGWYNAIDPFASGSMNLTLDPKTIVIDFSSDVDAASVEQSIKQGLNGKELELSFEWRNTKQLILKADGFKGVEDTPYIISMSTAKDSNGNAIYGDLYFVTSKPNILGTIDIKTKKDTTLYNFPDKRYIPVQNGKLNNIMVLDDTESKYAFNIDTSNLEKIDINREYTLGIPNLSFTYSYIDSNTLVLINKSDGAVISYSVLDGKSKELFALPIEIVKSNIFEMAASPDGKNLAIAYETLPPGAQDKHDFIINVFDIEGNSIFKDENLFMPRLQELFGSVANLKWLDNETLILEDNVSNGNKMDFNVKSIDIDTGKETVIAQHSFKPSIFQGKNLMKVESFKDFDSGERYIDIIKDDKKIGGFKAKAYQYDNFFFSDENTLIYNEKEKIFAYYIDIDKSEQLGNGYIAGLSDDGSKVYYFTNYKMFYYID